MLGLFQRQGVELLLGSFLLILRFPLGGGTAIDVVARFGQRPSQRLRQRATGGTPAIVCAHQDHDHCRSIFQNRRR